DPGLSLLAGAATVRCFELLLAEDHLCRDHRLVTVIDTQKEVTTTWCGTPLGAARLPAAQPHGSARSCPVTVTTSDVYYDPYDRNIPADPYPYFRRLRDSAPLYYNERYDFWAVSRFADVEAALIDKNTFSNEKGVLLDIVKADIKMPPGTLIHEQDPSHAIHRQ